MATYPIFSQEGGQRIAINPNNVTSTVEIEPKLVFVCLPDGGSANIAMSLEDVVARLASTGTWVRTGPDANPTKDPKPILGRDLGRLAWNEIALVQKEFPPGFVLFWLTRLCIRRRQRLETSGNRNRLYGRAGNGRSASSIEQRRVICPKSHARTVCAERRCADYSIR